MTEKITVRTTLWVGGKRQRRRVEIPSIEGLQLLKLNPNRDKQEKGKKIL